MIKKIKGTHWVSLFIDRNTSVYFDSFEIEYIPLELLNKIKDKSITQNIFRIQDNESVICRFYCITFIEYMLAGKTFRFINLFSLNDYKKNDKIIYKYFRGKYTESQDETRNYLLAEIKRNDLMSEKYKKTCKYLNYAKSLLILASTIIGCVLISAFASLVCVPVDIESSPGGLKIGAITPVIKKYKSIIKKRRRSIIKWYY